MVVSSGASEVAEHADRSDCGTSRPLRIYILLQSLVQKMSVHTKSSLMCTTDEILQNDNMCHPYVLSLI